MASDQARELRRQGIAAAKAGQKEQARQLLQQSLRLEPSSEAAWLWLATVARDQRERLFCLHKLLELNPNHEMGLQSLQQLGLTREQLAQRIASMARPAAQPAPTPAAAPAPAASAPAPDIPIIDSSRLAELQAQIDPLVREYLAPLPGIPGVTWVAKTRRRAGEQDALRLRLLVGGAAAAVLVTVIGIAAAIVLNTPELRGVVFAPTRTPTRTPPPPTATYTPTPGLTPTPSPTPQLTLTPSPTVPPQIPQNVVEPTEVYPPVFDRALRDAVALVSQGQYAAALPTLEVEVTRAATSFDPNPYYYRALALAGQGELQAAAGVLQEAQRRLAERPDSKSAALINAGLAQVDLLLAERALQGGQSVREVQPLLENVQDRAEAAIRDDPRLEQPYLTLAQRYVLARDLDRALGVLERGLSVLPANVKLIIARGEIYFSQREYERAAYQAFLALYIHPAAEPAHLLQIRTALAQDRPGLAVLLTQGYLLYYPGSALGYKLLGDARAAEGNTDLALEAYTQALAAGEDAPGVADALVARAKLYERARRYDLARDDLDRAFRLTDDPAVRALRMQAAYKAGNLATAQLDAEALRGSGVVPEAEIQLLQARILVDEARAGDATSYERALNLLEAAQNLPAELRPVADEYRARALYNLERFEDALRAVNSALAEGESGYRHYLRGLIQEALNKPEAAARDYDWVLTWSEIYSYPFAPDARRRLEGLAATSS